MNETRVSAGGLALQGNHALHRDAALGQDFPE